MSTVLELTNKRIEEERRMLVRDAANRAVEGFASVADASGITGELDELQDQLLAASLPCEATSVVLKVIEQLGVTFESEDAERAVEALGMVLVHSAVLVTLERMTIAPIVALAEVFRGRPDIQPLKASSALAAAVTGVGRSKLALNTVPLSDDDRVMAIVYSVALAIAKGVDDVEIGHDLVIRPTELLLAVGREVLAKPTIAVESTADEVEIVSVPPGRVMSQGVPSGWNWPGASKRQHEVAQAFTTFRQATADLEAAGKLEPGDFVIELDAIDETPESSDGVHSFQVISPDGREVVQVVGGSSLSAMAQVMERELAHAKIRSDEQDERMAAAARGEPFYRTIPSEGGTGDGGGSGPAQGGIGPDAGPPLAISAAAAERVFDRIENPRRPTKAMIELQSSKSEHIRGACPTCGAALSHRGLSDLWVCSNGHAFTGLQLAALTASALPPRTAPSTPPRRK